MLKHQLLKSNVRRPLSPFRGPNKNVTSQVNDLPTTSRQFNGKSRPRSVRLYFLKPTAKKQTKHLSKRATKQNENINMCFA